MAHRIPQRENGRRVEGTQYARCLRLPCADYATAMRVPCNCYTRSMRPLCASYAPITRVLAPSMAVNFPFSSLTSTPIIITHIHRKSLTRRYRAIHSHTQSRTAHTATHSPQPHTTTHNHP